MQSRRVRVKCPPDRELLAGRREFPAVHISHPAASEDSSVYYLLLWSENLQRRYFFMQKSSSDLFSRIFESSREFKKVTTITTCAMFGALYISHPAASEDSLQIPFVSVTVRLSPVVVRESAKEVFFYAKKLKRPLFQDL